MCYSLSQQCNMMQVDQSLYLDSSNINKEGLETQHQLGNTCSKKTTDRVMGVLAEQHHKQLEEFLTNATKNEWLLVLVIDDFTKIHTNRRPLDDKASDSVSMCTIVIKAYKHLKGIKRPPNIFHVHHSKGLDIQGCLTTVASQQSMGTLSKTYASSMPSWITKSFFAPELERHIMEEHNYCDVKKVRSMRTMENLHLANFFELQLKSKEGFAAAIDIALGSGLKQYLKNFVVVQPGGWPCQFYCRQLIYDQLPIPKRQQDQESTSESNLCDHNYVSKPTSTTIPDSYPSVAALCSIVPTMGPLHISLNSREHVFVSFRPFFEKVYTHLFPKSILARLPKAWRINLILETVYGAWTLIRTTTKLVFTNSKNLQYVALLNLLDNYLPLVLSIYTITFKRNDFLQYRSAMIRIWVMFVCLKRRHYKKSPLVWLSCTTHWENNVPQLYSLWKKWPTIFDEYPVENTHSILRAQTHQSDTAEQLTKKAKIIFGSKERQMNFRSAFTPPKQFTFSLQQLQFLKTTIISKIHSHPAPVSKIVKKRTKYVRLPDLFGPVDMKYTVLPVGYHSSVEPDESCRCDLSTCCVENHEQPWEFFEGCGHSFHKSCLQEAAFCPLCKQFLSNKVQELATVARNAILHPKDDNIDDINPDNQNNDNNDDDSCNDMPDSNTLKSANQCDLNELKQTVNKLNSAISSLGKAKPPLLHHSTVKTGRLK